MGPCTDQSTLHWALGTVLSTRIAAEDERAILPQTQLHALVYRRNTYYLTYIGPASGPNTAQMTTPVPWQCPVNTLEPSALVAKLETLLCNGILINWRDVLATAIALKAMLLRDPDADELCMHIDANVLSRCYIELQCPGMHGLGSCILASHLCSATARYLSVFYHKDTSFALPGLYTADMAAGVLLEALSRRPVLPCAGHCSQAAVLDQALRAEMQQQLNTRHLLGR